MRLSRCQYHLVDKRWFTCKMNDNTLIRFENLRALGKTPGELATMTGLSKQYWSNMLRRKKSFGEMAARNLEEKLELPRLFLDEDHSAMSNDVGGSAKLVGNEGTPEEASGDMAENESVLCQPIPTSMPISPPNLKSAILLMGSLVGALDKRRRHLIRQLLNDLVDDVDDPEEVKDIAETAYDLALKNKPITKNKDLNKALRGRPGRDPVETRPASLEH